MIKKHMIDRRVCWSFAGVVTDGMGGDGLGGVVSRSTVAAALGGYVAQATGGDFEDGAFYAAMTHLFNAEGNKYKKQHEAARDALTDVNAESIKESREYGGLICKSSVQYSVSV